MLWTCLLLIVAAETNAHPSKTAAEEPFEIAAARQQTPINAALTGFFSPPFVVLVSMGALFYTFEKFAKDMVKAASNNRRFGLRRKKKKPTESAPPPQGSRYIEREHRKLIDALENYKNS
ncbi:uncharacterized protein TNIN_476311 [Trichonephila inaurata madagascariensis]|uniref:Uncharacterized protein n=1 Tax=Trichonephila inaurata madagascariensis TaxID=2747483 RepID=A0A8X7BNC8_9ARAC|nr:uncharacterized protein TNIN_476311 [Trichonephila inaurata madagascariensis]